MSDFWYMLGADKYWTDGSLGDDNMLSMPGVKCGCCGETWGDIRFTPLPIPDAFADILAKIKSPVGHFEINNLKAKLSTMVAPEYEALANEIYPGVAFLPKELKCSEPPPPFFTIVDQLYVSSEAIHNEPLDCTLINIEQRDIQLSLKTFFQKKKLAYKILIATSPPIIADGWTQASSGCKGCGRIEWNRGVFDDDFRDQADQFSEIRISRKQLTTMSIVPLATTCHYVVSNDVKKFFENLNSDASFLPVIESP